MSQIVSGKFLSCLLVSLALLVGSLPAEAKRVSGGRSVGMQRDTTTLQRNSAAPAPTQNTATAQRQATAPNPAPAAAQTPQRRSWLGPLAGIAAGIGLAALASHLGLGEEFGSILLMLAVAMLAVFLFRRFFGKRAPQAVPATAGSPQGADIARFDTNQNSGSGANTIQHDEEVFLGEARKQFVQLQQANDVSDFAKMSDFIEPDVLKEIILHHEAGSQPTDIVSLHSQLLNREQNADHEIASVRFYGLLRENATASPESFDEVWHLVRRPQHGWKLAGIQQGVF